tara:strand:- start:475 stop:708 length:234 start_codon:yes stop_codon:yes gene_type:complete
MDIRRLIGKNLKEIRQARGLSQEALALECGLHRTYISGIERGARNPTALTFELLAITLDVKPSAFLAHWEKPSATDR